MGKKKRLLNDAPFLPYRSTIVGHTVAVVPIAGKRIFDIAIRL